MSDKVEAEKIAADRVQIRAELGLKNVSAIAEAGAAADRADKAADRSADEANKAIDANNKAQQAKTIATQQAATATIKAQEAKKSADDATKVVTGGTATLEPEAGKIPLADSSGRIADGWLPAESRARTEADMEAERAYWNEMLAASGMLRMGRSISGSIANPNINQGLWTALDNPNVLRMGIDPALPQTGDSKTLNAMTAIAGFISDITSLSSPSSRIYSQIKLPTDPVDGTKTYDSATGEVFDYKTQADPKYGDVAATHNEAVARAFDGPNTKNSDFRLGDTGWDKLGGATISTDGALLSSSGSMVGQKGFTVGAKYSAVVFVEEVDAGTEVRIIANDGNSLASLSVGYNEVSFTLQSTSSNSRILIQSTNSNAAKVKYFSVRPETNEVVTSPVDMWGFEGSLQAVTKANPFIYPNGLPQSKATTMDGVATTRSNRPDSYYAWFEGDDDSAGLGCDFFAASVLQRDLWLSNPKNKLYKMNDGSIAQWRVKGRSFRGPGNGDWALINANSKAEGSLCYSNNLGAMVMPQGQLDAPVSQDWNNNYRNMVRPSLKKPERGLWSIHENTVSSIAVNGECYFLVCGTVPRLNAGGYIEGLNEGGTAKFFETKPDGTTWGVRDWHESQLTLKPTTKADCFRMADSQNVQMSGRSMAASFTGKIGNLSGRPDGRFYDAIYPGGLGGVIDDRMLANDQGDIESQAKYWQMVKDGTYRGKEKLKRCKFYPKVVTIDGTTSSDFGRIPTSESENLEIRDFFGVSNSAIGVATRKNLALFAINTKTGKIAPICGVYSQIAKNCSLVMYQIDDKTPYLHDLGDYSRYSKDIDYQMLSGGMPEQTGGGSGGVSGGDFGSVGDTFYLVSYEETNISVSGEFLQKEVIGDPANILLTPQLKNGGVWVWNPNVPDGTSKPYNLTRDCLDTKLVFRGYTDDNGANWASSESLDLDSGKNYKTENWSSSRVGMYEYMAFAKQTKPATQKTPLHGKYGLGGVLVTDSANRDEGALLHESLMGAVGTGANFLEYNVLTQAIKGNLISASHGEIKLTGSTSPAVKALAYPVNDNGQASMQIIGNEMKWKTSSFGDSSDMNIAEGTYPNGNSEVCLSVIHDLAIPYGWVKNIV